MRSHSRFKPVKKNTQTKKRRSGHQRDSAKKLPRNTPPITLEITHIGGRGDGVGRADYTLNYALKSYTVFVPETLPGEIVTVQPQQINAQGIRAELIELNQASENRRIPPCPAFGRCGGCQLQHLNDNSYQSWKSNILEKSLLEAGVTPKEWGRAFWGDAATRRRATLSYRRTADSVIIGFLGRQTHFITPIEGCIILQPEIKALLAPLHIFAKTALKKGDAGRMHINMLDAGADITLLPDEEIPQEQQTSLASAAAQTDLLAVMVRLSIQQPDSKTATPLLAPKSSSLSSFGVPAIIPPASFLQASVEGEAAMIKLLASKIADNSRIIDLFCGAGTLSLGLLLRGCELLAIDEDGAAISAFEAAANQAGFGQQARFERRNLFNAPLLPPELKDADTVILDPPRQGAEGQMPLLRQARIPQILMVSCNPRSLARDLAILTADGLYHLDSVTLIDQFVYSTHIEAVACLRLVEEDTK